MFFGITLSENFGFIPPPDEDKAVETTLASLGATIKVSLDAQGLTSFTLSAQPSTIYRHTDLSVVFDRIRKETNITKEDIPIYKLGRSFLI